MYRTNDYLETCTIDAIDKEFVIRTEVEELREDAARKGVDERKLRETVRAEYDIVARGGRADLHAILRERSQCAIQKAD
jgi:hypothetical protein